jgi:Zn-dependent alcohol dehydrogenase
VGTLGQKLRGGPSATRHKNADLRYGLVAHLSCPAVLGTNGAGIIEEVGEGVDVIQHRQ